MRSIAVRPVFVVATTFVPAVIAGLMVAASTARGYGAVAMDRFLADLVWPAALVLTPLGFAHKAVDACIRPQVSEADVALASRQRQHRPLSPTDDAWHEAALAEHGAPEPGRVRAGFGRRTASPSGRRTPR